MSSVVELGVPHLLNLLVSMSTHQVLVGTYRFKGIPLGYSLGRAIGSWWWPRALFLLAWTSFGDRTITQFEMAVSLML
jgi:hypothetical protein